MLNGLLETVCCTSITTVKLQNDPKQLCNNTRMAAPPQPAPPTGSAVHLLSDDLLERIFACVADDSILRGIAPVCRRWAELLRTRPTLWPCVSIVLPPRLVNLRGRDRRHSYKLPCALDVDLMRAWIAARASAITELHVAVLYPDGMALPGFLTAPLAPGLRHLEIQAQMHDWPLFEIDWHFMQQLTALESVALHDAVPDLMALEGTLPRGLVCVLMLRDHASAARWPPWAELNALPLRRQSCMSAQKLLTSWMKKT